MFYFFHSVSARFARLPEQDSVRVSNQPQACRRLRVVIITGCCRLSVVLLGQARQEGYSVVGREIRDDIHMSECEETDLSVT